MPTLGQSRTDTLTIANGATQSSTLHLDADTLVGIQTPAALTSTALSFEASTDSVTWTAVRYPDGSAYSVNVTTSKAYPLPGGLFAPWDYVRIIAGSAEGGARSITVSVGPPSMAAPIGSSGSTATVSGTVTLGAGTAAYGKLAANDGVDIGDVTVNNALPTTFYTGHTSTVTAGTRVTLASSQALTSGVRVKALAANAGTIYVGTVAVTSSNGYNLAAGDECFIEVANLATVYIDSSVNAEGVSYLAS